MSLDNLLQDLKDLTSDKAFGMTKQEAIKKGVCINCKEPPTFYSEAGRKEYKISNLCEPCFDKITDFGETNNT